MSVDRVIAEVDRAADEIVDFAARLVRIPTVNPPGEEYEACANVIGDQLRAHGAEVQLLPAIGRHEHTPQHPRGLGWTRDPFGAEIAGGKLYGRGSCDMKAGIAAAVFAVEAIRRSGITTTAPIEVSGTVDEESGGFAGVAWLAENRLLSRERTKAVIIR